MEAATVLTELFISFIALYVFTKIMGRSQFSQLTPFDFISALVLGEIVGNGIFDKEVTLWDILYATGFWGLLVFCTVWLTQKFKGLRKLLEGDPFIIVHKGKFNYNAMKKGKIDLNEALMLMRQQGYFTLSEVEYAILEANGYVSVMPKAEYNTPTRKDIKLNPSEASLASALILDGEVIWDNLHAAGLNEAWLQKELHKQQVTRYKDVLYAEYTPNQQLLVNTY